jgi:prevent-host-death family protein
MTWLLDTNVLSVLRRPRPIHDNLCQRTLAKSAVFIRYWSWTRIYMPGTTAVTRLNVSKAREEFSEIVDRAAHAKERTVVSRRGKDLAAVIPIEDLRLLERLTREEMDRIDLEEASAALEEAHQKGTIPLRDLMRELGD